MTPNQQKKYDLKLAKRRAKREALGHDVSAEGRHHARQLAAEQEDRAEKNRIALATKYLESPAGRSATEQAKVADVISQGNKQPMTWNEVNSSGAGGSNYT
jgi:hypothetical protein